MKFDTWVFFENLSGKYKLYSILKKEITGTLHEDQYTFLSYLSHFFLGREIFETKRLQRKSKHAFHIQQFKKKKSFSLWDNVEKYCGAWQATDDSMAHAHFTLGSLHTAKDTPPEYVILLFHCKRCGTKAPECNTVRVLPLLSLFGLQKIWNVSVASCRRSERRIWRRLWKYCCYFLLRTRQNVNFAALFYVFCTLYCNIIIKCQTTKSTFSKLTF